MNHTDIAINEFNDRMTVKINELPPTLPKSFFKEYKFSFADSYDVRCRYTSRIGCDKYGRLVKIDLGIFH